MYPSFQLFGKDIGLYPICALLGIFSAGILAMKLAEKRGINKDNMLVMLLTSCVGVLLGGHILYGITNYKYLIALIKSIGEISFADFFKYLYYIFGGMVYYGGLIGGIIAGGIYIRHKKLPLAEYSDICAPAVPLFHVFGRIGCFLGGCCYGIESKFGFIYSHALDPAANGVRRFPIQLAEAAVNFLIFLVLYRLLKNNKLHGKLFCLYLIIYSVCRFILEFWRGDVIRGFVLGMSTSQFISILIFIFALVILYFNMRRQRGSISRA